MKFNIFNVVVTTTIAGLVAYCSHILVPIFVLGVIMVADYFTGVVKGYTTATLNSKKGILGFIKKLCYFLLVLVGCMCDYLITVIATDLHIEIGNIYFVGLILTIWLIINECLSILENLAIIGVPIPKFLISIVNKLEVVINNSESEVTDNDNN